MRGIAASQVLAAFWNDRGKPRDWQIRRADLIGERGIFFSSGIFLRDGRESLRDQEWRDTGNPQSGVVVIGLPSRHLDREGSGDAGSDDWSAYANQSTEHMSLVGLGLFRPP